MICEVGVCGGVVVGFYVYGFCVRGLVVLVRGEGFEMVEIGVW